MPVTPSNAVRAGIIATVTIVATGLMVGQLTKTVSPDQTRTVIGWGDGGPPPSGGVCVEVSGVAQVPMLKLFGLRSDAGAQYAHCRICGTPREVDGGTLPSLPSGMYGLVDSEFEVPFDAGHPQMECWIGEQAPFPCACAKTYDCYVDLPDGGFQTAPSGVTLQPGWSGEGCVRKSCVELAGQSSWPAECAK